MRRSDQRRDAAFAIYQRDVTTRTLEELLADVKPFTRELAEGTDEHLAELDAEISAYSRGWKIERIAPLEKAIMRIALFEIHHCEETPVPVAIDEAVSITKRYCGTDAPGFVNGILAASARGREGGNGAGTSDPAPEAA